MLLTNGPIGLIRVGSPQPDAAANTQSPRKIIVSLRLAC